MTASTLYLGAWPSIFFLLAAVVGPTTMASHSGIGSQLDLPNPLRRSYKSMFRLGMWPGPHDAPPSSPEAPSGPITNCSSLGETTPGGLAGCALASEDSISVAPSRPPQWGPAEASCTVDIMTNAIFNNTSPDVIMHFKLPEDCGSSWKSIILEWKVAALKPPQYDRLGHVFVNGVGVFFTCTEEPFNKDLRTLWNVTKDITEFAALFRSDSITTQAGIFNIIDAGIPGYYNASARLVFFASDREERAREVLSDGATNVRGGEGRRLLPDDGSPLESQDATEAGPTEEGPADIVLPVTRGSIQTGVETLANDENNSLDATFILPRNIVRASLRVFAIPQGPCEEFYYWDIPSQYFERTTPPRVPPDSCVNPVGGFREIVAMVDGQVAGVAWPFSPIFTGGIWPSLWRPIVATSAFDLPSYAFDVTPFVGRLVNGLNHTFSFRVLGINNTNAAGYWALTGSVHLWTDKALERTGGEATHVDQFTALTPTVQIQVPCEPNKKECYDGTSYLEATRTFVTAGYVTSSQGQVETRVETTLSFSSLNENKNHFYFQALQNDIKSVTVVATQKLNSPVRKLVEEKFHFPLALLSNMTLKDASSATVVETELLVDHAYVHQTTDSEGIVHLVDRSQSVSGKYSYNLSGPTLLDNRFQNTAKYAENDRGRGCYTRLVIGGTATPVDVQFSSQQILRDAFSKDCPLTL